MLIVYICHMHGCVFCAETDGVAACVNQWEVQNYVLARFSSMPSWTTMLILYFYQSLRKILNDFDNQNFFANFYSNVILKRKKLVLTLKSTGKMFSIMIPIIQCRPLKILFTHLYFSELQITFETNAYLPPNYWLNADFPNSSGNFTPLIFGNAEKRRYNCFEESICSFLTF